VVCVCVFVWCVLVVGVRLRVLYVWSVFYFGVFCAFIVREFCSYDVCGLFMFVCVWCILVSVCVCLCYVFLFVSFVLCACV